MIGLTAKQRELYDFIAAEIAMKGFAPSFAEMATAIGCTSPSNVYRLVTGLEERGYIHRLSRRARAIELLAVPTVTLNTEILALTDRYAAEERVSRDTAVNSILREWLSTYFRSAA